MPIYEYGCPKCRVIFNFLSKRINPERLPVCPKCGKEIERWQTGFYTRQPLPTRKKTAVWAIAGFALLLILAGFAKACHWV